jgi:hypothetical protein
MLLTIMRDTTAVTGSSLLTIVGHETTVASQYYSISSQVDSERVKGRDFYFSDGNVKRVRTSAKFQTRLSSLCRWAIVRSWTPLRAGSRGSAPTEHFIHMKTNTRPRPLLLHLCWLLVYYRLTTPPTPSLLILSDGCHLSSSLCASTTRQVQLVQ